MRKRPYTRGFLETRLHYAAKAMGWPTTVYARDEAGVAHSVIGAVCLEKAPSGWRIVQVRNAQGGQGSLTGSLSASELVAWFDGLMTGKSYAEQDREAGHRALRAEGRV